MSASSIRPSAASLRELIGAWQTRPGPAYRQLADAIQGAVLDGRLSVGARLPAERELATALLVSRTTVAGAYAKLRDDGWLTSRRGSGSVITVSSGNFFDNAMQPTRLTSDPAADAIDLTMASRLAPDEAIDDAVDRAVERMRALYRTDGYFPLGFGELRERVAARYCAEGVDTTADNILITNGAQHGLSLALGDLTHTLDRVIVESPTYPLALDLIRHTGRIPMPIGLIPGQQHPWLPELITSTFRQAAATAAFLIPDFHNPVGALMDDDTRATVMKCASESHTTVIVDESFRMMSFGEVHMPRPVAYYDTANASVSVGSLSKPVWGALRVGWVRAGAATIGRLGIARALGDMSGSLLDQLIAIELLDEIETIAARQSQHLKDNRDTLLRLLNQQAPTWEVVTPHGGVTAWVRLPQPVASEAARLAPRSGVHIVPGTRFGPDGTMDNYVRIPLTPEPGQLEAAVPRIIAAVQAAEVSQRPRSVAGWLT